MATRFNLIALAAGVIGFALIVLALGGAGIERAVVGTGAWFVVIALVDALSMTCDAFGIHGFLRARVQVTYGQVFVAEASGLAINRLTPGNALGEPVKVTMLVRHVPAAEAVAAIAKFNLATTYVGATAIVVGVPLTAATLDLPPRLELAVWIAAAVLVALAVAGVFAVRRGMLGIAVRAIAGLRVISTERVARWRASADEIDGYVREFGGWQRGLAGVVGSRLLNWLGTVLVLYAADIPLTAPLVIAMLSVGILVTWLSNIIPLGLGLADGTNYILYGLLGASPEAGVLFTVVNRLRTCVIAGIGLAVMAIANARYRSRAEREGVAAAQPVDGREPP